VIHLREDIKIISKLVRFFLEKIGIKLDAHKLKKFIDLEFIIIEKIVAKLNKLHPLYLDFYGEMIENEINLAKISKDDKILHIGCGTIPATSILIAKKTGAQVTGIDNNSRSVNQALYYLSKFKLSDKVKIKHAETNKFPVKKFDLIIISQGIKPCNVILDYVAQSMRYDARVIFRTNSSTSGELNQNDTFLKDIFKVGKIISHKKNGLLISILLNKK
jgi:precorrin-6B methylase 2